MKKYSILFGCCLFLLVGFSCILPISTNLIRDAYIGSALSFRINDAIALAYPEMELEEAIELQELVERHPQLNKLIHNYLCAYGDYLWGGTAVFESMDNEKFFDRMNQNILAEAQKRNPGAAPAISREDFLALMKAAEAEVESVLQNRIPHNLQNFGKPGLAAIVVYRIATSIWTRKGLLLLMVLLLIKLAEKPEEYAFYTRFWKIFVAHGCFWAVIIPVGIKAAGSSLLGVVDRILGRSMYLDVTPFLWSGGILAVIGILLLLLGRYRARLL